MKEYTFILNPRAGRGEGEKLHGRLQEHLSRTNLSFDFVCTRGPGDATVLAREAESRVVVAVGGDGTVNEVANGLIGTGKILGVIPAGSGNDFIKSLSLTHDLRSSLQKLLAGKTVTIDVGTVACGKEVTPAGGSSNLKKRYFVNGVGIGFDAMVAKRTAEIGHLRGVPLYVAAVFGSLGKYKAPLFSIAVDGYSEVSRRLLIAVGNGPCAGGGFYLTPDARVDDGVFDLCLVDDVSIPTIMRLMPRVMRGKHRDEKRVKFLRGKEISINAEDEFYVHADGEIVGDRVRSVRIHMLESALTAVRG